MLIGWDRGHFFLIFFRTKANLLIPDWPSAKLTRIWLAGHESAPFAFCRPLETKNGFWVVPHKDRLKVWPLTGMVGKNGNRVLAWREIPKGGPICVYTGNNKRLFVLKLLKTLERRGQQFFQREKGSQLRLLTYLTYLLWVLSLFCQWTRNVFISLDVHNGQSFLFCALSNSLTACVVNCLGADTFILREGWLCFNSREKFPKILPYMLQTSNRIAPS